LDCRDLRVRNDRIGDGIAAPFRLAMAAFIRGMDYLRSARIFRICGFNSGRLFLSVFQTVR